MFPFSVGSTIGFFSFDKTFSFGGLVGRLFLNCTIGSNIYDRYVCVCLLIVLREVSGFMFRIAYNFEPYREEDMFGSIFFSAWYTLNEHQQKLLHCEPARKATSKAKRCVVLRFLSVLCGLLTHFHPFWNLNHSKKTGARIGPFERNECLRSCLIILYNPLRLPSTS